VISSDAFAVGFTATRRQLYDAEKQWVIKILTEYYRPGAQFHHGDCLGGDVFGHEVATSLGYFTVAHPARLQRWRAYTINDYTMPELDPIDRNHQIVIWSKIFVAVPPEREVLRSGTWSTVRYARDKIKGRIIRNWWIEKPDDWSPGVQCG